MRYDNIITGGFASSADDEAGERCREGLPGRQFWIRSRRVARHGQARHGGARQGRARLTQHEE